MKVGTSKNLTVKGTSAKVKWSSSNKKVAIVTKKGKNKAKIVAKKAGTTMYESGVTLKFPVGQAHKSQKQWFGIAGTMQ